MIEAARPYHRARRAVGLLLLATFLVLPFVKAGGDSVLRFDVPTLRLHVLGATVWMQDFFLVLLAIFALVFAAIFLTIDFGRLWCGWACPQTVLVDLSGFFDRGGRGIAASPSGILVAALLAMAVSAAAIGYFVSPYRLAAAFSAGSGPVGLVTGIWAVLAIGLTLDLVFLRRKFCAKACPYAKLQGVLFDDRTLVVAYDGGRAGECMKCSACVRACPMGIDIREGSQVECIHCAECVDACAGRMARRGRPSLVRYSRGRSEAPAASARGGPRVPLIITGMFSAVFSGLLLLLVLTRPPFEASLHPVDAANALVSGGGAIAIPCKVTLRNLTASPLELGLSAASTAGTVLVSRGSFELVSGAEPLVTTITLVVRGVADPSKPIPLVLSWKAAGLRYEVTTKFAAVRRPGK